MKYLILFMLMLPPPGKAQSKVSGLGEYIIGVTSPDSLDRTYFEEQDQPLVKGTLTLPCTHIRLFKSSAVDVGGLIITNLWLAFYDNTLFTISCDYSEALNVAFRVQHGKGVPKPTSSFSLCATRNDKPLVVWGESWQNADILARVVHSKGYNSDCQMEEANRLIIVSQRFTALSSDCDLKTTDQLMEVFNKVLNKDS